MSEATRPVEPRILQRSEHPISRKNVAGNALKVLYRLHNAGYKAHLVGGGVRDLLLGRRPKDFDVVTDARPKEIRRLFRNSRIIGRRFRLAHIFFKDGIIEVSTFRRDPDPSEQASDPGDLLITSDNTFGTPEEDAFRRDFTVNALFYNIADYTVIDYVGGIDDMEQHLIRVIGDPDVRFQEDPVRMLRACEFAARLGFGIEASTQEAIHRQVAELEKAAPARLTEEIVQLLGCGRSGAAIQWMLDLELLEVLLPEAYSMVAAAKRGLGDFAQILPTLDAMVEGGAPLSESVLLAAFLLPTVLLHSYDAGAAKGGAPRRDVVEEMVREAIEPFVARFTLSRQRSLEVHRALSTFQLLGEVGDKEGDRQRLARHASFPDALSLLEILVRATGEGEEVLSSWKKVQGKAASQRPGERAAGGGEKGKRRRRRRRRRRKRRED